MAGKPKLKYFIWHGVNAQGFRASGKMVAYSVQAAQAMLCQQNIAVLKLSRRYAMQLLAVNAALKPADITEFSIELVTLVSAGISLAAALRIMADSAQKSAMQQLLHTILQQIEGGCSFSEALKVQPNHFNDLYCNLVYAGEQSGTLELVLQHIAQHREKLTLLTRKIKKALFYPSIVLLVALGVTCAMLLLVMPQFAKLYQSAGAELPWLTQMVMHFSSTLQRHGTLGLLMLLSTLAAVKYLSCRLKSWQNFLERFWLQWPLLGSVLQQAMLARCFRTLAITLAAGLPILDALRLSSNIAGNMRYAKGFEYIAQQVKNGQTLHLAFHHTGLFPYRAVQMLRIGEQSGRLDYMLQKLSDGFEQRLDDHIHHLTQLLEPALMIFLSLVVGTLLIAMYLPIFRLGAVI